MTLDGRDRLSALGQELPTLERVAWFKHHRLMGPLGHVPPAEFEADCHRQRSGRAATV